MKFLFIVFYLFFCETVYAAWDCTAALASCSLVIKQFNELHSRHCPDTCGHDAAGKVFLFDWSGDCDEWNLKADLRPISCDVTTECPAGMPVGADSNDYALMTKGQPYTYGTYAYDGCAVSCSGTDSTVPLSCSQNGDQKHAVRGCIYTGDEDTADCDFGCTGLTRQLYQATQPAPEDCNGPLGVHWTKAIPGTSRLRGCVCDYPDLVRELVDRCAWVVGAEAWKVVAGAAAGAKAGAAGGFAIGAAGGAATGAVAGTVAAALSVYASNCAADPVNPSATNVVNCPWQRVGDECVIPPNMTNTPGCQPPLFESHPGSGMCITEQQATVTRDQQSETHESFPPSEAQQSTPSCPSGTTPSQGVCWCTDTGRIYTAKYGCDGNGTTPDDPPPDEPGNTTTNDNNQNQDQGGTGYHVWVDNQSEVYSVLNAIKDKMCGWAAKPCQVHTDNGTGGTTTDKVVVENFEQLLEAVNAVNGGVESIRVSASKTEDNTTVIRADIDWMKQDLSVIKSNAENIQNSTSIAKDHLSDIKDSSSASAMSLEELLRVSNDTNFLLDQTNTGLEEVGYQITNVYDATSRVDESVQNLGYKLEPLSSIDQTAKDILEELKKEKPCVECCVNDNTPPDDTPPEEETKCVDTEPKDGVCDVIYDLQKEIKEALYCTDADKNKVCDVLEKKEDEPPEEEPLDVEVKDYTGVSAGTCPTIDLTIDMGIAGTNNILVDFSNNLCKLLSFLGYLFLLSAYYTAARVYFSALTPIRPI
ncbi:MAG: hypothetical protein PHS30_05545 [Bacteroidales bacterium]|nr:hypothetical protein [Bacteroidales bacterium]